MPPTSPNPAWLVIRDIGVASTSNIKCPRPKTHDPGAPLFYNGSVTLHQFMVYLSAGCMAVTILSSVFLSWRHLHRYTSPQEQRQILRIVNLPVFYSIFNFLALTFTLDYLYIQPLGDLYEAFTVAALFLLVLDWVAPDGIDREKYFDKLELRSRRGTPQAGGSLKWFQRIWGSVLAYPVLKTVLVVIQIITQYFGVYCENSFSPKHAHLYLTLVDYIFVGGALGATIQFFRRLRTECAPIHKPRAKIISFLGIVVFQIIQDLIFHILNGKLFSPTAIATYNDINFGIASLMTCIEAVIFSLIFHWAFSAGEYKGGVRMDRLGQGPQQRTTTFRAVLDALNLADIVAGSIVAFQFLFMRVRSRYGAAPPSRDARDQTLMQPLGGFQARASRGYDNLSGGEEFDTRHAREEMETRYSGDDVETRYARGYHLPPFPPAVRDPSPRAAYGEMR